MMMTANLIGFAIGTEGMTYMWQQMVGSWQGEQDADHCRGRSRDSDRVVSWTPPYRHSVHDCGVVMFVRCCAGHV